MEPEELTQREREVLDLATRGLSNDAIAERLGLTHNAVRFHLKRIHAKLGTGGDRRALSGFRKWVSGLGFGVATAKLSAVAPVVALGIVGAGLAGATVLFLPDHDDTPAVVTPDATGRYPNGCPATFTAQPDIPTLADYAAAFNVPYADLVALNPGLPASGTLPAGADVHIPYRPDGGCAQAEATPPGSRPAPGGTPTPPVGACPDCPSATPVPPTPAGFSSAAGRLASREGDMLVVVDGEGDHTVRVTTGTLVSKATLDHRFETSADLSRLRIGDSISIAGHRDASGDLVAVQICANCQIHRPGLVVSVSKSTLQLRPGASRLSAEFLDEAIELYTDPSLALVTPLHTLNPGDVVQFEAAAADDGSLVLVGLYGPGPP